MKAAVAGSIALSLATGCFYPEGWSQELHHRAYVSDGIVVAAGAVLMVLPCENQPDTDIDCHTIIGGMGALMMITGGVGLFLNMILREGTPDETVVAFAPAAPNEAPPGATASDLRVPPHDGPLGDLAVRAALAARVGDCGSARASMRSILRDDPAYYEQVMSSEPALAACFGAP